MSIKFCMSAPMVADLKWQVNSHNQLQWRTWGEESLVFNPESGDTHLLDQVAREGLKCLEENALGREELCRRLAERLDVDASDELQQYVDTLIARFDELGLLELVNS